MRNIFLVAILGIAACGPTVTRQDSDEAAKNGCASASAALKVLTVARANHKLSPEQIAQVDAAKAKTDAICKHAPYPTLTELEMKAVTELATLAALFRN